MFWEALMKRLLALVVFLVSHSLPAYAITNGGFETGDFSGWTIDDALVVDDLSESHQRQELTKR